MNSCPKVRQRLSNIQQSYPGHMQEMINELDKLEREAKYGRALLWAVETGAYIANPMMDGQFYQGDLDELMNDYEENGGE